MTPGQSQVQQGEAVLRDQTKIRSERIANERYKDVKVDVYHKSKVVQSWLTTGKFGEPFQLKSGFGSFRIF